MPPSPAIFVSTTDVTRQPYPASLACLHPQKSRKQISEAGLVSENPEGWVLSSSEQAGIDNRELYGVEVVSHLSIGVPPDAVSKL